MERIVNARLSDRNKTAKSTVETRKMALNWLDQVQKELGVAEEAVKAKRAELWRAREAHMVALSDEERYR